MERNKKSTDDIKKFFQYTGKLSSDYIFGIKLLCFVFILIMLAISARPVSIRKTEVFDSCFPPLYASAYMVWLYIRPYLFAGAYQSGSVSAKVQKIYDIIRYVPYDSSVMRKELLRRTALFLVKITAAGGVIQLIKFAAAPKEYRPENLISMAVLLFVWPFAFGTANILLHEKSIRSRTVKNTGRKY